MIQKYFPNFQYLREGDFRWCYVDETYLPLIQKISDDFKKLLIEKSSSKHSHISFSYDHSLNCSTPVFIKFHHVRHIKQKIKETLGLKHKYYGYRFGIAEALNLLKAQAAGVNCPDIYAIGEVKKGLLIDSYIVILEYLSEYKTLSDALKKAKTDAAKQKLLANTESIILDLFNKGVYHSDFSSKNIMFSLPKENTYKVVDFEYIRFLPDPNASLLAFQLGYLYQKWCSSFIEEKAYDKWVDMMLRRFPNSNDNNTKNLYDQAKTQHFSRRDIITLVDNLK
jgi:tRNA A-37 threonylcarbamoyl transferase component Bud32